MKAGIIFLLIANLTIITKGQTISSTVISSSGDYYPTETCVLSITVGELVVDNYTSAQNNLNTGFQQGIGNHTVALSFFLEGFYNNGAMNQVFAENPAVYPSGFSDKYQLHIAKSSPPYTLLYSDTNAMVQTSGKSHVKMPAYLCGNNYFVIKHRNHIETWSANPVSFAGDTISYSFKTSPNSAFGNNLKYLGNGVYGFYSGDVNQDGSISLTDLLSIETSASSFSTGYISQDLNGDGIVDALDLIQADNNAANFVTSHTP